MARENRRQVEWTVGLSFVLGMLILLILAISQFEGPTTVVLLVLAGVFLLIGVFFLAGGEEAAVSAGQAAPAPGPETAAAAPVAGATVIQQGSGRVVLVCPGCSERVTAGQATCMHCGTQL